MRRYIDIWLGWNRYLYRHSRKRLLRALGFMQRRGAGGQRSTVVITRRIQEPEFDYLGAFGLKSITDVPVAEIAIGASDECKEYCKIWASRAPETLKEYFSFTPIGDGWKLRHTPMLIELSAYANYGEFENYIKKFSGGERLRMAQRARAKGYEVKTFHWNLFIPDIHAINTSTKTRSGGEMRGGYLRSIEEMGGPPKRYLNPPAPVCRDYWQHCFGVFEPKPGYKQGEVETNERLLAYFTPRRMGDVIVYSMLLGHYDHLNEGIMDLGHQHIVRWILESGAPELDGVKYLMYGGMENGTQGLFHWKRRAGFKPYRVYCKKIECRSL